MEQRNHPKPLPKLADLHHDIQTAFANDELNLLLNQPPSEKWLKSHPIAKNWKYLPIDKVEFLLLRIFQEYRVEVKSISAMFNSIVAIVRLHYRNPVTGEWCYHDGTGAVPVQTDGGAPASDLSKIKSAAIQIAAPSSVSYAIKDAAEHIGAIFGRDLNRKDTIMFSGSYNREDVPQGTTETTVTTETTTVQNNIKQPEDDLPL